MRCSRPTGSLRCRSCQSDLMHVFFPCCMKKWDKSIQKEPLHCISRLHFPWLQEIQCSACWNYQSGGVHQRTYLPFNVAPLHFLCSVGKWQIASLNYIVLCYNSSLCAALGLTCPIWLLTMEKYYEYMKLRYTKSGYRSIYGSTVFGGVCWPLDLDFY